MGREEREKGREEGEGKREGEGRNEKIQEHSERRRKDIHQEYGTCVVTLDDDGDAKLGTKEQETTETSRGRLLLSSSASHVKSLKEKRKSKKETEKKKVGRGSRVMSPPTTTNPKVTAVEGSE